MPFPPPVSRALRSALALLAALLCLPALASAAPMTRITTLRMDGAGHVPCRDNTGADLPPEQYSLTGGWQYPTAAKMGQSVTVTVTWFCPANASGPTVGTITASNGLYGGVIPVPVDGSPRSFSISPGGTCSLSWTVGPLPSYVYPKALLSFQMNATWTQNHSAVQLNYAQDLYLVYDTPTAPLQKPWLGVLDDACAWAIYQNTPTGVMQQLTLGEFYAQRFVYPSDTAPRWINESNGHFKLRDYLEEPGWVWGNCVDVSDYLSICANALGADSRVAQYRPDPPDANGKFVSNPVCLIGYDPMLPSAYDAVPGAYSQQWAWHQVTHLASDLTSVYDVCGAQAVDLFGNGYQNPPLGWFLTAYWYAGSGRGLVASPVSTPILQSGPYVVGVE
jgi:hypothetical protein